ncbi:MAG: hypothetical protein EOO46_25095, partial [Flavobacterium sp.]
MKISPAKVYKAAWDYMVVLDTQKDIEQGLKYIENYIQSFKEDIAPGYFYNSHDENAKLDTKPDLKPITFRTLHFLLHSILFAFSEIGFIKLDSILDDQAQDVLEYFKQHIIQDYHLIQQLLEHKQPHIWLYQVIASFHRLTQKKIPLKNNKVLKEFESSFEAEIIDPLIQSTHGTIQEFNRNYIEYIQESDADIYPYIAELKQNTQKYPLLEYFNYIKLPSLQDFWQQFTLLHSNSSAFPLLNLLQEKIYELSYLPSLPIITNFTNYLMKKFNYQISRDQANSTQIKDFFDQDPKLQDLFATFENKWNILPFESVR